MLSFSDRYGYTRPLDAFITEQFPQNVANDVCTILDKISRYLDERYRSFTYHHIEEAVWCDFMHQRLADFPASPYGTYKPVSTQYILNPNINWFEKLNLLEFIVGYLLHYEEQYRDADALKVLDWFVDSLNACFKNLHYGYRVVDYQITPIVDESEIVSVEQAVEESNDNVREHLQQALNLFAKRPDPDYRNSIKESISAVECLAREITGESTLDRAFPKLKTNGVQLNSQFEEGLKRLYYYTNDGKTGIRHALMEDTYTPTAADAQYMLVTCSAFVNLIRSKMTANS